MKIRYALAAATAGLLLATTTAAHAAGPPYTVSVGGSSAAGTQAITFASTGTVMFSVRNSAGTIVNYNCTSVSGSATVTKGVDVNPYASITSTTWVGCRLPGGAFNVTQEGLWNLTGTGANATVGTETVAGHVGNVSFGFATNPATVCSFTVSGKLSNTFNESAQ